MDTGKKTSTLHNLVKYVFSLIYECQPITIIDGLAVQVNMQWNKICLNQNWTEEKSDEFMVRLLHQIDENPSFFTVCTML